MDTTTSGIDNQAILLRTAGRCETQSSKHLVQLFLDHREYLEGRYAPSSTQGRFLTDVLSCGTLAQGDRIYRCSNCGLERGYNRCGNRFCDYCARAKRGDWCDRQIALLPGGVPYLQYVFKWPPSCTNLLLLAPHCKRTLYNVLFAAARKAIVTVHGKRSAGLIGGLLILQTFGEGYVLDPHIHAVIPALVGLPGEWVPAPLDRDGFLPDGDLTAAFRLALVKQLRTEYPRLAESFHTAHVERYLDRDVFVAEVLAHIGSTGWACLSPSDGTREDLIWYVSHESPLTKYPIAEYDGKRVTVGASNLVALEAKEFLKRLMKLLVPPRLHTRRAFGVLANRAKGDAGEKWRRDHPVPGRVRGKGVGGSCSHQWKRLT
jgi:hypothetical protein